MQDKDFERRLKRQDVQLLLTQLMKNEETTIKLILERLYDTGTTNWLDQKVRFRLANRSMKVVAQCAKPAGRYFGYRWLVKNTPSLIAGWLFRQVDFTPETPQPVEVVEQKPAPQSLLLNQQQQIHQLQRRLRLASGVAILSIISMGGLLVMEHGDVLTQWVSRDEPVSQRQVGP